MPCPTSCAPPMRTSAWKQLREERRLRDPGPVYTDSASVSHPWKNKNQGATPTSAPKNPQDFMLPCYPAMTSSHLPRPWSWSQAHRRRCCIRMTSPYVCHADVVLVSPRVSSLPATACFPCFETGGSLGICQSRKSGLASCSVPLLMRPVPV